MKPWGGVAVLLDRRKEDELVNWIGDVPYLIPKAVSCPGCWEQDPPCTVCSGTGRAPIPFSEVW